MPFETELTGDCMGIVHVGSGIVTGSEILEACRSVTALVQTTENFHYKLVDLTAARDLQISEEELRDIVEEDRLIAHERPQAVVAIVAPNEKMRVIARHWQGLVAELGWTTQIVRNRAEATAWLHEHTGAPA
jgi:hypothetical protein